MNEIAVVSKGADWRRLKALVLDSISSPITKRVYNVGLDEFFDRYGQEPQAADFGARNGGAHVSKHIQQ